MPSNTSNGGLLLDDHAIREIVNDVSRKFILETRNISFHFDRWGISIVIHAEDRPFNLPHGPVDVRVHGSEIAMSNRDIT